VGRFEGTGLGQTLRRLDVRRVVVCGLALEYCVRAACLDAIEAGFESVLLTDGTRAVEVSPGDGERTMAELREAGVEMLSGAPA